MAAIFRIGLYCMYFLGVLSVIFSTSFGVEGGGGGAYKEEIQNTQGVVLVTKLMVGVYCLKNLIGAH